MDASEIIRDACHPTNKMAWQDWKSLLHRAGLQIMDDDSGLEPSIVIPGDKAQEAAKVCTVRVLPPPEESIEQWTEAYEECLKNPPMAGDILYTDDKSPVRLNVELVRGRAPFIYGLCYVPSVVGEELGWFMTKVSNPSRFGFKVAMMPKCRQEIITRRGLRNLVIPVKSVRIVRPHTSGQTLLGEVCEWE